MDSIPLLLQTDGMILRSRSVPSELHPPLKNGCVIIWIFAGNIVFQILNEKAWTIF